MLAGVEAIYTLKSIKIVPSGWQTLEAIFFLLSKLDCFLPLTDCALLAQQS